MEIEIREVDMDEANETVTLHFETEKGHRFNKVIKIDEDTDTKAKLKKHIVGMADDIAAEYFYGEVTFEFQTNAYFYEPPEGEEAGETGEGTTYTEEELDDMSKNELLDAANKAGSYTEDMEKSKYTKAMIIDAILEGQEEPEE